MLNQLGCEVREVLEAMLQADTDRLKRENLSRDGNDEDDDDAAYEEDGPKSPEGAHRKRTAPSADDRDNDEDDDDEDSELPFSFYLDPSIGFSYKMAPGRRFTSLKNVSHVSTASTVLYAHKDAISSSVSSFVQCICNMTDYFTPPSVLKQVSNLHAPKQMSRAC